MAIQQVDFLTQQQAQDLAPPENSALISIINPGDPVPEFQQGWSAVYRTEFVDGSHDEQDIMMLRVNSPHVLWDHLHRKEAQNLRQQIEQWSEEGITRLFVHGQRGLARAAAIAKFACDHLGLAFESRYDNPFSINTHVYDMLMDPDALNAAWTAAGGWPTRPDWSTPEEEPTEPSETPDNARRERRLFKKRDGKVKEKKEALNEMEPKESGALIRRIFKPRQRAHKPEELAEEARTGKPTTEEAETGGTKRPEGLIKKLLKKKTAGKGEES